VTTKSTAFLDVTPCSLDVEKRACSIFRATGVIWMQFYAGTHLTEANAQGQLENVTDSTVLSESRSSIRLFTSHTF
jgi:hypothetical protein